MCSVAVPSLRLAAKAKDALSHVSRRLLKANAAPPKPSNVKSKRTQAAVRSPGDAAAPIAQQGSSDILVLSGTRVANASMAEKDTCAETAAGREYVCTAETGGIAMIAAAKRFASMGSSAANAGYAVVLVFVITVRRDISAKIAWASCFACI